jgi:hypothetical protein
MGAGEGNEQARRIAPGKNVEREQAGQAVISSESITSKNF